MVPLLFNRFISVSFSLAEVSPKLISLILYEATATSSTSSNLILKMKFLFKKPEKSCIALESLVTMADVAFAKICASRKNIETVDQDYWTRKLDTSTIM